MIRGNLLLVRHLAQLTLLLLGLSAPSYSANVKSSPSPETPVFQLHILKKLWREYEFHLKGNTPKKFLSALKYIDIPSESLFSITENDIESYNWPDQSILLTLDAYTRFMKALNNNEDLNVDVDIETAKQRAELSVNLGFGFEGVFVVIFKGKALYGGAITDTISAPGYRVPTLCMQIAAIYDTKPIKIQFRFVIRPLKIMMEMRKGYQALEKRHKRRIEIKEIHDFFEKIHKLTNDKSPQRVEPWLPKIKPIIK